MLSIKFTLLFKRKEVVQQQYIVYFKFSQVKMVLRSANVECKNHSQRWKRIIKINLEINKQSENIILKTGGELCRTGPFTSWQYQRLYTATINGCIKHPKFSGALHFVDKVSPGLVTIEKAKVYGAKRHGKALGTPEVQTLLKPKNYF